METPTRSTEDFANRDCQKQHCPECERPFVCEIAAGCDHCWCMKLPAALPVDPAAKCRCEDCLRRVIEDVRSGIGRKPG